MIQCHGFGHIPSHPLARGTGGEFVCPSPTTTSLESAGDRKGPSLGYIPKTIVIHTVVGGWWVVQGGGWCRVVGGGWLEGGGWYRVVGG